jgi:hypothetical protein
MGVAVMKHVFSLVLIVVAPIFYANANEQVVVTCYGKGVSSKCDFSEKLTISKPGKWADFSIFQEVYCDDGQLVSRGGIPNNVGVIDDNKIDIKIWNHSYLGGAIKAIFNPQGGQYEGKFEQPPPLDSLNVDIVCK